MSNDYRDAVIRELADSEGALLDRVVDLQTERDAYQALAKRLLEALHEVTVERDVLRGQMRIDRRRERQTQQQVAA